MEYTGESYRCTKCYHTWDYEDDRCPECGSMYMEDFYKEKPIPLTEEWLLKFGWKYLNGRTSGDLTKDTNIKMDIDFINGKLKIKSHYEGSDFYRDLNIIHVHRLQNFFESINEDLTVSS